MAPAPAESPYFTSTPLIFKTLPIVSTEKHTAVVIFLHGLGDSGDGVWPYVKQMSNDPCLRHVKWIIPDAPMSPVTGNMGRVMPSWFDVLSFDIFTRFDDEPSLLSAVTSIKKLITSEIEDHGILSERIVIGGISQGGALACLTGVTSDRKLAGVFVLSAYVPLWRKTGEIATSIAPSIPIFWGHGTSDSQVNHEEAFRAASDLARDLNVAIHLVVNKVTIGDKPPLSPKDPGIRFNSYSGLVHWIDPVEELADLVMWLRGVVPMETAN